MMNLPSHLFTTSPPDCMSDRCSLGCLSPLLGMTHNTFWRNPSTPMRRFPGHSHPKPVQFSSFLTTKGIPNVLPTRPWETHHEYCTPLSVRCLHTLLKHDTVGDKGSSPAAVWYLLLLRTRKEAGHTRVTLPLICLPSQYTTPQPNGQNMHRCPCPCRLGVAIATCMCVCSATRCVAVYW